MFCKSFGESVGVRMILKESANSKQNSIIKCKSNTWRDEKTKKYLKKGRKETLNDACTFPQSVESPERMGLTSK